MGWIVDDKKEKEREQSLMLPTTSMESSIRRWMKEGRCDSIEVMVDEKPVVGLLMDNCKQVCEDFLKVLPSDMKGQCFSLLWLAEQFTKLPLDADPRDMLVCTLGALDALHDFIGNWVELVMHNS
ncbi:serine/threonine-protein phosphatase 7 long form-like protein [Cucumis melo var. makuwa]|uniref:Serine/threonine-protein phosphatase 7 long form-like protein n=1 Tax=Cucumis melo var. makuwa TaxID=1194695 RepID=A0A5A7VJE5_CUCMM|nr:serine/threonine-protein phosphatase 7 long form-like protein [Cucumis melo var. makuwa]TYK07145.1 serine/threonine-protein phosphatase 7 long form-like protein [Cucumis melo var. makuwa]